MEKITADEAARMLEAFTGKRYQIGEKETRPRVEYPKRYMRRSEILKMKNPLLGWQTLERAAAHAPAGVVRKLNPLKKNSPLVFDTVELEKWRVNH